jgi:hypothetical protein
MSHMGQTRPCGHVGSNVRFARKRTRPGDEIKATTLWGAYIALILRPLLGLDIAALAGGLRDTIARSQCCAGAHVLKPRHPHPREPLTHDCRINAWRQFQGSTSFFGFQRVQYFL